VYKQVHDDLNELDVTDLRLRAFLCKWIKPHGHNYNFACDLLRTDRYTKNKFSRTI